MISTDHPRLGWNTIYGLNVDTHSVTFKLSLFAAMQI